MKETRFLDQFRSLWIWWGITTVCYLLMTISGGIQLGSVSGYLLGFIGLFVPYGLYSLLAFINPLAWVSVVFFVFAMIYASRKLNEANDSLGMRILKNLLVLLVITFLVDIIRFTPFASWQIFFDGGVKPLGISG
jgi:hypothetical protein